MRELEILPEFHFGPVHMVSLLNTSPAQPTEPGDIKVALSLLAISLCSSRWWASGVRTPRMDPERPQMGAFIRARL